MSWNKIKERSKLHKWPNQQLGTKSEDCVVELRTTKDLVKHRKQLKWMIEYFPWKRKTHPKHLVKARTLFGKQACLCQSAQSGNAFNVNTNDLPGYITQAMLSRKDQSQFWNFFL